MSVATEPPSEDGFSGPAVSSFAELRMYSSSLYVFFCMGDSVFLMESSVIRDASSFHFDANLCRSHTQLCYHGYWCRRQEWRHPAS
jgi:hypothetical protein